MTLFFRQTIFGYLTKCLEGEAIHFTSFVEFIQSIGTFHFELTTQCRWKTLFTPRILYQSDVTFCSANIFHNANPFLRCFTLCIDTPLLFHIACCVISDNLEYSHGINGITLWVIQWLSGTISACWKIHYAIESFAGKAMVGLEF